MYPFPDGAGELQVVVKHRVANVDTEVQEAHNLGYYRGHLGAMVRDLLALVLLVGSTAIQGTQGLAGQHVVGQRGETRSVTYGIRLTGAFSLCQYGLTSSQPDGAVKVASRSVAWTVAPNVVGFPTMRHMVIQDLTFAKADGYLQWPQWEGATKKKRPRLAKRRNGEEAKGRPSHSGRAILGRSTCFTDNLLQNVVKHEVQPHHEKCR